MKLDLARAPWLDDAGLQHLLSVLTADGEEARVAGGAVRNALLGEPVSDLDIATTVLPAETVKRAEAAGFKAIPTGFDHGTVTVVVEGRAFEVTTLRADIETDGRHAKVRFGRDWKADAERRDFTINALYANADGTVLDLVGGLDDIASRTLRFIGDAETRIREDYLRILRFFRFFAWYGRGRPDAEGLKACARLKGGLDTLSVERVWAELCKTLAARDPARALLWMRQAGVLSRVLPESEKWGIDAIHGMVETETAFGWPPDALLRLQAIVPPDPARMEALARRLKLSKADAGRLREWAMTEITAPDLSDLALRKLLYVGAPGGVRDRLRLALAGARARAGGEEKALVEAASFGRLLELVERWQKPRFPVSGGDLSALGFKAGPEMGRTLARLEKRWIESGFVLGREALLAKAGAASA